MKTAKMSKKVIMIVLAVVVLCGIVSVLVFGNRGDKVQELLDLGQSYLEDGNYEQAVATLEALLEIDPKTVKVEESRRLLEDESGMSKRIASAYVAWIDSEMDAGNITQAQQVLEEAWKKTDGDGLEEIAEEMDDALRKDIAPLYSVGYHSVGLENLWIPQDEINEIYQPMAERLESRLEVGWGEIRTEDYEALARAYYEMNQLERCLEIRKKGYEATGDEKLNPEGYMEGNVKFNQYGMYMDDDKHRISYEGNRIVEWGETDGNVETRIYDGSNRLVERRNSSERYVESCTYEYQGMQVTEYVHHGDGEPTTIGMRLTMDSFGRNISEENYDSDGQLLETTIYTYDEYGFPNYTTK